MKYYSRIIYKREYKRKAILLHGHEVDHVYSMKVDDYNELIRKMAQL